MLDTNKLIDDYFEENSWRTKENANMSRSISGMEGHLIQYVNAKYVLDNILSEEEAKAHKEAYIHIHDLGSGGLKNYCLGVGLEEFLYHGLNDEEGPAKHFSTALRHIENFTFAVSQEIAGAVAYNDLDIFLAPYIKNDKLTYQEVKQIIQQFVYTINYKYRVSYQSPFTNIQLAVMCPKRLENRLAMVGKEAMTFTYGECLEEAHMITKALLETLLEANRVLPFPVINLGVTAYLDQYWDTELNDLIIRSIATIGQPTVNNYVSGDYDPDSVRSMCCFNGEQEVIVKNLMTGNVHAISFKRLEKFIKDGWKYQYLCDGEFENAELIKIDSDNIMKEMYKITTHNNKEIIVTADHLHYTDRGIKNTLELREKDYLRFTDIPFENKSKMTYAQGVLIGAYLGDGSIYLPKGEVTFSINYEKWDKLKEHFIQAFKEIGMIANINTYPYKGRNGMHVKISSKQLSDWIKEKVIGNYSYEKQLHYSFLNESISYRNGIKDGYYITDGGNRNRIYSTSKQLIEDMELLFTSLGIPSIINIDDRVGQETIFPDGHVCIKRRLLYCIRFYNVGKKYKYKDYYKIKEDGIYFSIKSIEQVDSENVVYCLEMENDEKPYFTLPNGIITDNCSIRLDYSQLQKQSGGQFGAADNSGSVCVVTLNLPKLAYETKLEESHDIPNYCTYQQERLLFEKLDYQLNLAKSIILKKRSKIEELIKMGMYPNLERFVPDFANFFNTIGIIGLNEMCLNLVSMGIDTSIGKDIAKMVINHINKRIGKLQEEDKHWYNGRGLYWNLELVPAEGVTHRFAKHDKKQYPDIITANGTGEDYYTRGCWLPADQEYTLAFATKHQDELQDLFSGGANFNVYLEGTHIKPEAIKNLIYKLVTKTSLPFISISPTIYICPVCGKRGEEYCYHEELKDE